MVTLISSTHRPDARTHAVTRLYADLLRQRGIESRILSLEELPHDFIRSDLYGHRSDAFRPIEQLMADSQMFVFIAPEYNGSYPGELKVFIDALNRKVLSGKHAALIGLSAGKFGNLRGLEHLAGVLTYAGVELMPFRAHLMHIDQRLDMHTGQVTHEPSLAELNTHADKLLKLVHSNQVAVSR